MKVNPDKKKKGDFDDAVVEWVSSVFHSDFIDRKNVKVKGRNKKVDPDKKGKKKEKAK